MSLITIEFVKNHFPLWSSYFKDVNGSASDAVLTDELDLAEAQSLEYYVRTADTISAAEKIIVLNIVIYRGFMRIHGDTQFEHKPRIVVDYEAAVNKLNRSGQMIITSNEKKFTGGNWFAGEE